MCEVEEDEDETEGAGTNARLDGCVCANDDRAVGRDVTVVVLGDIELFAMGAAFSLFAF